MIKLERMRIDDIIPYENNPRINDEAVDAVAESIRQCGYVAPIIVDENNVILAGHTRLKALMQLGYNSVDVAVAKGLREDQKKKYRLLDNKTNELAEWDFDKLAEELEGLDFDGFDFGFGSVEEAEESEENPYTAKVNIPQYEPKGMLVELKELTDTRKYRQLIEGIEESNLPEDEKCFLRMAAARHIAFDYRKIAEYYAEASPEMQEAMEDSALVILDMDDAIAKGYAVLKDSIEEIAFEGEDDD